MTELHGKIYLTKADMPKSCNQCPFCNGADECMVQNEDVNFLADTWDDLRRGCPLEEIDPVTVQEWISVKDRLPEEDERVIVWIGNNRYNDVRKDTDRVHNGKWVRWGGCVTHWAPWICPNRRKENKS